MIRGTWIAGLLCAVLAIDARAQFAPCDELTLPPSQRWNPRKPDVSERLKGFYALGNAVETTYNAGDTARAATLAKDYLAEAAYFRCNWNYGNAIHNANLVIGMDAVRRGDKALAAESLVRAGASPGSPQLNSFGPTLVLAQAVLEDGDRVAVERYLTGIGAFWKMDDGAVQQWLAALRAGRTPDFSRYLKSL